MDVQRLDRDDKQKRFKVEKRHETTEQTYTDLFERYGVTKDDIHNFKTQLLESDSKALVDSKLMIKLAHVDL